MRKMIPGLVSVTFRKLDVRSVLDLCVRAGLGAIEWGGDIHVPPDDIPAARKTAEMTRDAGIRTVSYGSYYRLGQPEDLFMRNLEAAEALDSGVIRIWAGSRSPGSMTERERDALAEQLRVLREEAEKAGITLAPEFHMNTLTGSLPSLKRLLLEIPELRLYWQPRWDWPEEDRLEALDLIGDRLAHVHVFSWRIEDGKEIRLPLESGESMWRKVLTAVPEDTCALLEFVRDDSPDCFLQDAAVLKNWLETT